MTRLFLTTFIFLILALASVTQAAVFNQFDNVYVFGDSLSDAGYFDAGESQLPHCSWDSRLQKQPTYTTCGGFVWAYHLAQLLIGPDYVLKPNNEYAPASANVSHTKTGTDYAIGGAVTGPVTSTTSLAYQVNAYLTHNNIDPNALYILWGGGNDLMNDSSVASVQQAAQNIADEAGELVTAGATYVLIIDMPEVSSSPRYLHLPDAERKLIDALCALFNSDVRLDLKNKGLVVNVFDEYSMQKAIIDAVSATGTYTYKGLTITNVTVPICNGSVGTACSVDSEQHLFADDIHPTDLGHHILAEKLYGYIMGPQFKVAHFS